MALEEPHFPLISITACLEAVKITPYTIQTLHRAAHTSHRWARRDSILVRQSTTVRVLDRPISPLLRWKEVAQTFRHYNFLVVAVAFLIIFQDRTIRTLRYQPTFLSTTQILLTSLMTTQQILVRMVEFSIEQGEGIQMCRRMVILFWCMSMSHW